MVRAYKVVPSLKPSYVVKRFHPLFILHDSFLCINVKETTILEYKKEPALWPDSIQ
jgi:hypothetical protein